MLYSQLALLEYTGHQFYLLDPHSSSVQVILERRWEGEEGNESWENTGILGIVSPLLTEQQSAAGPQQSGSVWAPWGGQAAGTFSLGGAQISMRDESNPKAFMAGAPRSGLQPVVDLPERCLPQRQAVCWVEGARWPVCLGRESLDRESSFTAFFSK